MILVPKTSDPYQSPCFFCHAALHEHDPVFKRFSFSENISNIFPSLAYKRPAIDQSRYIFKVDFAYANLLLGQVL